jgi:predicted RNase H-like HicB family nuclease
MRTGQEIRLLKEEEGWWSAIHQETGVASQDQTRDAVLNNLDEAVELTTQAHEDETPAPEPDAPWFET